MKRVRSRALGWLAWGASLLAHGAGVLAFDGPAIPVDGVRPATMPGLVRRWPVAVHAVAGTDAATIGRTLSTAEIAAERLHERFALPSPTPDGTRGGGSELDVYLVDPNASLTLAGGADVITDTLEHSALWDRASSFVVVDRTLAEADAARALAEAMARALLRGVDARIPRAVELALASTYAESLLGERVDPRAFAAFQASADGALFRDRDDLSARGAAVFTDYLARRFDTDDLHGLGSIAWMNVAATPGDRDRFVSAPHVFDVLARTLRDAPGGLQGAVADFTLARALAGTAADTLGFGGVGVEPDDHTLRPQPWFSTRYADLPAWISPARPLDETGAAFIAIDTSGARDAGVNLWLHAVPFRIWTVTVARIATDGTLAGIIPRTPVDHGEWNTLVENLDGIARVIVVVNDFGNGNLDPYEAPSRNGLFALHVARH